jgi:hypothetical protein
MSVFSNPSWGMLLGGTPMVDPKCELDDRDLEKVAAGKNPGGLGGPASGLGVRPGVGVGAPGLGWRRGLG